MAASQHHHAIARGAVACYNRDTASLDRFQAQPKWEISDNRFHDPHEKSSELKKLREFHDVMDRAVLELEACGWDVLGKSAQCEFLLDYEEGDELLAVRCQSDSSLLTTNN